MPLVRLLVPLVCLVPAMAAASTRSSGDVDADGAITLRDAARALQIVAGMTVPDTAQRDAADVAGAAGKICDFRVSMVDVATIARTAGGLESLSGPDIPAPSLKMISQYCAVAVDSSVTLQFTAQPVDNIVTGVVDEPPGAGNAGYLCFREPWLDYGFHEMGYPLNAQHRYHAHLHDQTFSLFYVNTMKEMTETGPVSWDYRVDLKRSVEVLGDTVVDATGQLPSDPATLTGGLLTGCLVPTAMSGAAVSLSGSTDMAMTIGLRATAAVASGRYRIRAFPADYQMRLSGYCATAPDITFTKDVILPVREQAPAPSDIELPTVVPITVAATAPSGTRLVSIVSQYSPSGPSQPLQITRSYPADAAEYSLMAPEGDQTLIMKLATEDAAGGTGTLEYKAPVTVPAGGGAVSVSLPSVPRRVAFGGKVVFPDGRPAPGATVYLQPTGTTPYSFRCTLTTDAVGAFSTLVVPGLYWINIPPPIG